jgi:hypothetical protein
MSGFLGNNKMKFMSHLSRPATAGLAPVGALIDR